MRLDDIKARVAAVGPDDESPIVWDYRVSENDVALFDAAMTDIPDLLAVVEAARAWMAHEVEFGPAGVPYYVYTGPSSKLINPLRAALAPLLADE